MNIKTNNNNNNVMTLFSIILINVLLLHASAVLINVSITTCIEINDLLLPASAVLINVLLLPIWSNCHYIGNRLIFVLSVIAWFSNRCSM